MYVLALPVLSLDAGDRLALRQAIALGHVTREYPNKLDHVMDGGRRQRPRATCTRSSTAASTGTRACTATGCWPPCCACAPRWRGRPVIALFDDAFTDEKVAAELAYLATARPRPGFERPYGWAWLLMLQPNWRATKQRLGWRASRRSAAAFAERFGPSCPRPTYPVRTGHPLQHRLRPRPGADYADDEDPAELIRAAPGPSGTADDAACQAWEPSGDEFLSPTLIEAAADAPPAAGREFRRIWFDRFLPDLRRKAPPATLFTPATVSDRSDGKIAHLDGLNLSRAWCWRGVARRPAGRPPSATRRPSRTSPSPTGDAADEHPAPVRPAPPRRRLHGRALAGELRPAGETARCPRRPSRPDGSWRDKALAGGRQSGTPRPQRWLGRSANDRTDRDDTWAVPSRPADALMK
jgi:hypothetical protein